MSYWWWLVLLIPIAPIVMVARDCSPKKGDSPDRWSHLFKNFL